MAYRLSYYRPSQSTLRDIYCGNNLDMINSNISETNYYDRTCKIKNSNFKISKASARKIQKYNDVYDTFLPRLAFSQQEPIRNRGYFGNRNDDSGKRIKYHPETIFLKTFSLEKLPSICSRINSDTVSSIIRKKLSHKSPGVKLPEINRACSRMYKSPSERYYPEAYKNSDIKVFKRKKHRYSRTCSLSEIE